MAEARLTISSKNYSSWSMRGWLLCKIVDLDFVEKQVPIDDPSTRAELLLLSPSFLVPCLEHNKLFIWDTLAIAEYLHEIKPEMHLLPSDLKARTHCRAISGEMHQGFSNLRSALPLNIKAHFPNFKIWAGAQADIDHVLKIWADCLDQYGGPFLFGAQPSLADAMYAPVCLRFKTYDVKLEPKLQAYMDHILAWAPVVEWVAGAQGEPDEIEELEMEF